MLPGRICFLQVRATGLICIYRLLSNGSIQRDIVTETKPVPKFDLVLHHAF